MVLGQPNTVIFVLLVHNIKMPLCVLRALSLRPLRNIRIRSGATAALTQFVEGRELTHCAAKAELIKL